MLTQCDRCAAVFRVHPAQLRQAQGFVRCGACQQVFYAVDRLLEEREAAVEPESPKPDDTPALTAHSSAAPPTMLQAADLPPLRRNTADLEDADELEIALARSGETDTMLRPPAAETGAEPESPRISISDLDAASAREDKTPVTREQDLSVRSDTEETDANEPEVLRQDLAALRSMRHERRSWRLFWVTSALLLLLILAGQIAWQLREPLFMRFPDWRTPVGRWCAALGCRLDAEAKAPEVELLARDVRDHPRFPDALLANITMISRAQSVRRYPLIEMSLFDRTGHIIGRRRFAPDEYLDPSIDVDAGMQPSRPVFVVLEFAGTHRDAVGFEFAFR